MTFSEIMSIFLNLLVQYITFVGIFYYFNGKKISLKEIILGVLIVFIPALLIYYVSVMESIFYLFLSQFLYAYYKYPHFKTLTYLGISIVIGLCVDHLTSIVLFDVTNSFSIMSILRVIMYLILSTFFAFAVKKSIKHALIYLDQKSVLIFTFILVLMIAIFYINIFPYFNEHNLELLLINGLFISLFSIIFFMLSAMLIRVKFERHRFNIETREHENFKLYVAAVERINNDMQKFRHDYLNVLLSMKGFIDERDIEGLVNYFDEDILKFEHKTLLSSKVVRTLERLNEPSLKGLLFNKFIYAHEKDIPISLDIAEPIQLPKIKQHIDFIRIAGILLDNAIENSITHPHYRIEIALVNLNDNVLFVIRNQINTTEFDIKQIFQEGFSTKGNNRGIGLSSVKNIVSSVNELSMHYWVEEGWYNVELFIKGGN